MDNYENTGIPNVQTDVKDSLFLKRAELTRELRELDAIISRVQQEYSLRLERLLVQKKPLEEALYHVDALLRFEGQQAKDSPSIVDADAVPPIGAAAFVTDAALNLLEEFHKPMHYKYIAAKLREANIYIPGKNPAATLLTRMSRDTRFKRTRKRGIYVLSSWRGHTTRNRFRQQAILLPQPWELHIGKLQDLVATGKVKNQFSLFALGIPYGRG